MTIIATISISCMLAVCSFAQVTLNGPCPHIRGFQDFSTAKFTGRWHEARRFYSKVEDDSKCNSALYSTTDSDHTMKVKYHLISKKTKEPVEMEIKMTFDSHNEGEYIKTTDDITDQVLDTDYDNFAIVWSCKDATPSHTENAWIITREVAPSDVTVATALKRFEALGLDKSKLIVADQTDC